MTVQASAGTKVEMIERLRREHRELETKISELEGHLALSPQEEMERSHLKKLKLLKKDQIQALAAQ